MISKFRHQFNKDISKIKDKDLLDEIFEIIINVEKASTIRDIANLKKT